MLFSGGVPTSQGRILDHLVDFGKGDATKVSSDSFSANIFGGSKGIDSTASADAKDKTSSQSDDNNKEKTNEDSTTPQGLGHPLHWLKYKQ